MQWNYGTKIFIRFTDINGNIGYVAVNDIKYIVKVGDCTRIGLDEGFWVESKESVSAIASRIDP